MRVESTQFAPLFASGLFPVVRGCEEERSLSEPQKYLTDAVDGGTVGSLRDRNQLVEFLIFAQGAHHLLFEEDKNKRVAKAAAAAAASEI